MVRKYVKAATTENNKIIANLIAIKIRKFCSKGDGKKQIA